MLGNTINEEPQSLVSSSVEGGVWHTKLVTENSASSDVVTSFRLEVRARYLLEAAFSPVSRRHMLLQPAEAVTTSA